MADLSDVKKTNDELIEEATADMTGAEKFFDFTSGSVASKLMGGAGGMQTTKHLGRQYIELKGEAAKSQSAVHNMTFQISDEQYQSDLEEINKDVANAITLNDIQYNLQTGAATFATFASAYQGARNAVSYVKSYHSGVAPTIPTPKSEGGVWNSIKANLRRPDKFFAAGSGKLATTDFIKSGGFKVKVGGFLAVTATPFLATYGVEGIINKVQQDDILAKTQETLATMASVREGAYNLENDEFIQQFEGFMTDFSTGYHDLESKLDNGEISQEEFDAMVGELNTQYQNDLSTLVGGLSEEDQLRLAELMASANEKEGFELPEDMDSIDDLNGSALYTIYGSIDQKVAYDNPYMEVSAMGRDRDYIHDKHGDLLDGASEECKEAGNEVAAAINEFKYGVAESEIGAFFHTLNSRIVNACPAMAHIEAVFLKTVDSITDAVMDWATDGQHVSAYENQTAFDIAHGIKLNSEKQVALTDTYNHMMASINDDSSWMPQDYESAQICSDYLEAIAQAESVSEVRDIVDGGADDYYLAHADDVKTDDVELCEIQETDGSDLYAESGETEDVIDIMNKEEEPELY